jgi:RNA polymerase sigma-70 factor, ECF subfamily
MSIRPCDDEDSLFGEDSDSLASFFHRYSGLVFSIGLRMLGDRGEAEELVQEVFWHLYRKRHLYDPSRGMVRTWLVQVAQGKAANRHRHLKARKFYVQTMLSGCETTLVDMDTPEAHVENELRKQAVHVSLAALSHKQRLTLELVLLEGCTLKEVSARMKESVGNTRHHYYRGLQKVRSRLSRKFPIRPRTR